MKTPEELKESLEACFVKKSCAACHYDPESACLVDMCMDAKALIEKLEEENMCMKIQMHGDCGVCKHRHNAQVRKDGPHFDGPCHSCIQKESRPNWEYEGLPEVKSR